VLYSDELRAHLKSAPKPAPRPEAKSSSSDSSSSSSSDDSSSGILKFRIILPLRYQLIQVLGCCFCILSVTCYFMLLYGSVMNRV